MLRLKSLVFLVTLFLFSALFSCVKISERNRAESSLTTSCDCSSKECCKKDKDSQNPKHKNTSFILTESKFRKESNKTSDKFLKGSKQKVLAQESSTILVKPTVSLKDNIALNQTNLRKNKMIKASKDNDEQQIKLVKEEPTKEELKKEEPEKEKPEKEKPEKEKPEKEKPEKEKPEKEEPEKEKPEKEKPEKEEPETEEPEKKLEQVKEEEKNELEEEKVGEEANNPVIENNKKKEENTSFIELDNRINHNDWQIYDSQSIHMSRDMI